MTVDGQKYLAHTLLAMIEQESDDDYEVNPPQMERFIDALRFLTALSDKCGGCVRPAKLKPNMMRACASADFDLLSIDPEDMPEFNRISGYACRISADVFDETHIRFVITIPDVFRPRKAD